MANKLIKHLLGYGFVDGNAGYVTATEADLTTAGSVAVVGVCTDWSGNIYLSDATKHIILKVTEGGVVRRFAGQVGISGMANGTADEATFSEPAGIACDRSGNIYVADHGNNQIRKIDLNGNVSLLAGDPAGSSGVDNGANFDARFNAPYDVTVDYSGNVYVADTKNNKIRLIRGASTFDVAGSFAGVAGDVVGKGSDARFDKPYGIACDRSGKIFVADSLNQKIKFITNDFVVYSMIGPEFQDGDNFNALTYLDVDNSGFVYVVDYDEVQAKSRLIKLNQEGVGGIVVDFDTLNIGIAVSPNQTIYVAQSDDVEFDSSESSDPIPPPP